MHNVYNHFVIVGAGGIGAHLGPILAKLLAFRYPGSKLTIIDGDEVEDKNLARVYNDEALGENKAMILGEICEGVIPEGSLEINVIEEYVHPDNVDRLHREWLQDGVVVLGCVDNNKSRALLEDLVGNLSTAVMINGGNSEFEGQSQMYVRAEGEDVVPRPSIWAADLRAEDPEDVFPGDEDCSKEYESAPQLILANSMAANLMLMQLFGQVLDVTPRAESINEITFDLHKGSAERFQRKVYPTKTQQENTEHVHANHSN